MAEVESWTVLKGEMEEYLDLAKALVLEKLALDGSLDQAMAEEWSATHTIILKEKEFFRTISNKWRKSKGLYRRYYLIVVKMDKRTFTDGTEEREVENGSSRIVDIT